MKISKKGKDLKFKFHKDTLNGVSLEDYRGKWLVPFFNPAESCECFISVGAEIVNIEGGEVAIHGTYLT